MCLKIPYRVYGRGGGTKLGANGRDDTFSVGKYSKEGNNNVVLTGIDSRPYILMVAIVRKRTEAEVRELMAKPETLEEARDRICRAISGGGDDSDDEIVTLSTVISLKCPLTGMRVKVSAARPANPFNLCYTAPELPKSSATPLLYPFLRISSPPQPSGPLPIQKRMRRLLRFPLPPPLYATELLSQQRERAPLPPVFRELCIFLWDRISIRSPFARPVEDGGDVFRLPWPSPVVSPLTNARSLS